MWAQLDAASIRDGLFDVLPALVGDYGDAAATLTAEWYDEHRADLNVRGSFVADVPANPQLGVEALAGWGSSLAVQNPETALQLLSGGLVKRVFTASRDTTMLNVDRDPQARGWQRKARPNGCSFCQMLAGRGLVYRSQSTADFSSHDNCGCTCIPAFSGRPVPVKPYTPTSRNISDADRARVRAWIAANQ